MILIVFCLLVYLLVFLARPDAGMDQFSDPDAYMRLVRCQEFLQHLDVRDHHIGRSNAPEGETLHWSRPLDFLLAGGSWSLRLLMGDRAGLSLFAYWISPLLQAGLLFIILPALTQRLGRLHAFHFGFLILCQPGLIVSFMGGRPDHHSLLLLLFAATAATALSRLKHWAWLAGLSCGIAAWVSVEAIATCFPFYGYWTIRYLLGKHTAPREALAFSVGWLVIALPAVWIETPGQILDPSFTDRLSGMHLLALFLGGIVWAGLLKLESRFTLHSVQRLVLITLGGGSSLAILLILFPQLIHGPYADVHPDLVKNWLANVKEVQPLVASPDQWLARTVTWLWPAYLSIPWLIVCRRRWLPLVLNTRVLLWVLAALLFTPLAFYQIRWVTYAEFLWLFPCLFCLQDLLDWIKEKTRAPWQRVLVVACVLGFAGGYLPIVVALRDPAPSAPSSPADSSGVSGRGNTSSPAASTELAAVLVELSPTEPRTILTRFGLGPELLYRTHHRVIATPYHRNHSGILYLRQTMRNENMEDVRMSLSERGVHWILLEPDSPELSFYGTREMPDSFHQRLLNSNPPPWLKKIPLPEDLETRYHLYQVVAPADSDED